MKVTYRVKTALGEFDLTVPHNEDRGDGVNISADGAAEMILKRGFVRNFGADNVGPNLWVDLPRAQINPPREKMFKAG
jgi:hypothetical protein